MKIIRQCLLANVSVNHRYIDTSHGFMIQLNMSYGSIVSFICDNAVFMTWLILGTNNHLVGVLKTCFGAKFPFWSLKTELEISKLSV